MSNGLTGAVLGAGLGSGAALVLARLRSARRTSVTDRVLPYLRDLAVSATAAPRRPSAGPQGPRELIRAGLAVLAGGVERVLGGSASVRRRLERAALPVTVHEFRIEQAVWGIAAFGVVAVPCAVLAARRPDRSVALLALCLVALVLGVLLRENRLTAQAVQRERLVLEELPVVAELLALAVAAGESPVAALDRVVRRSRGAFATDLAAVLAEVRTGTPLTFALDQLGVRSGLGPVSRFAQGMAIAIERGTPLADVLHAQAGDVREAARRALIESGARREVLMMVPVVFLVLPTVVVFAFWPGLVGLNLVVP
ncbi:MAG: pilus assembly protein TadB [Marmoricola sp.]|nr:pilus assembly protein TadB [Marmoricola sp.]